MGIVLTSKALDATAYAVSYPAVVSNGLKYLNLFSAEASISHNLAGIRNKRVVGNPVAKGAANGVVFSNDKDYVDSVMEESDEFTLFSVFVMPLSDISYALSNSRSNPNNLSFTLGANQAGATLYYGYGNGLLRTITVPASGIAAVMGRVKTKGVVGAVIAEINNLTTGGNSKLTYTEEMGNHAKAGAFRVGSGYATTANPTSTVLFAAAWDRYLTDDEMNRQYAQIKDTYAAIGVSI